MRWFVADLARATKSYQAVFGATSVQPMGDKASIMIFPGGAMPGLILIEAPAEKAMHGSFVIQVADVKATLAKAEAAGGKLMNTKFAETIAGVPASSSHFTDPDGNVVEVLQMGGLAGSGPYRR
nr:VOC family protein [Novosphingobium aerophilum]